MLIVKIIKFNIYIKYLKSLIGEKFFIINIKKIYLISIKKECKLLFILCYYY